MITNGTTANGTTANGTTANGTTANDIWLWVTILLPILALAVSVWVSRWERNAMPDEAAEKSPNLNQNLNPSCGKTDGPCCCYLPQGHVSRKHRCVCDKEWS